MITSPLEKRLALRSTIRLNRKLLKLIRFGFSRIDVETELEIFKRSETEITSVLIFLYKESLL